jgi:hypothetical protein
VSQLLLKTPLACPACCCLLLLLLLHRHRHQQRQRCLLAWLQLAAAAWL